MRLVLGVEDGTGSFLNHQTPSRLYFPPCPPFVQQFPSTLFHMKIIVSVATTGHVSSLRLLLKMLSIRLYFLLISFIVTTVSSLPKYPRQRQVPSPSAEQILKQSSVRYCKVPLRLTTMYTRFQNSWRSLCPVSNHFLGLNLPKIKRYHSNHLQSRKGSLSNAPTATKSLRSRMSAGITPSTPSSHAHSSYDNPLGLTKSRSHIDRKHLRQYQSLSWIVLNPPWDSKTDLA